MSVRGGIGLGSIVGQRIPKDSPLGRQMMAIAGMQGGYGRGSAPSSAAGGGISSGGGYTPSSSSQYDKISAEARKRLEGVGAGTTKKFDQAWQDKTLSQASDMTAAANAQASQALKRLAGAGGGSLYDPSMNAAEQELTSARQGENVANAGKISTMAQGENFEAQQAANRLLAQQETRTDSGAGGSGPLGMSGGRSDYGGGGGPIGGVSGDYGKDLSPQPYGSRTTISPGILDPGSLQRTGYNSRPSGYSNMMIARPGSQAANDVNRLRNEAAAGSAEARQQAEIGGLTRYQKSKYDQALSWGRGHDAAIQFARNNS